MNKIEPKKPPVKKIPPGKPAVAIKQAQNKVFDYKIILFFIVVVIAYIVFLTNFFSIPELTNKYIKSQASWVSSVQILLYTLITLVFAFTGYLYLSKKEFSNKRMFLYVALAAFILIMIMQAVAFNPAFEDVDDNAAYVIGAKSLVEKGDLYYLYLPKIIPDTELPWGLPMMLVPFYLIFGMDTVKMEIFIYFLFGASLIALFYFFKKYTNKYFALIIAILYAIHPYIVAFTSIIMTEIPYLFWSLLSLFLVLKYRESQKFNIWLMLLTMLAVFMTYMTRAVGAGAVIAIVFYMFIKSGFFEYINLKKFDLKLFKDLRFKKFLFLTLALVFAMIFWQVKARLFGGPSQAESFLTKINGSWIKQNLDSIWLVLSQNIFAGTMVRKGIEPVGGLWILVFLLTVTGFIIDMIKKQLLALYTFFVLIVIIIGNPWFQPQVVSRYLIIFTPMFIYFFFLAIKTIFGLFGKKAALGGVAALICLSLMIPSSLTGTSWYVQAAHTGELYTPSYGSFIECAKWAKDNLPADAIVASRKERIFYIYSNKRGFKHTGYRDEYSAEFEKKKLAEFKEKNTKYLILDTFNGSTYNNIYPIVQHNPDKFKLIKTIGDEKTGPCYVFEIVNL